MSLFKKRSSSSDREANAVFEKIHRLMQDEALQNGNCPAQLKQLMAAGGAVDQLPDAVGVFGRDLRNPIPVNGPFGELIYISNLRLPNGIQVTGHRLGSRQRPGTDAPADVYEIVALDGSHWDKLVFDPYHPRKSRMYPQGLVCSSTPEKFLLATNQTVSGFPVGIAEAMQPCAMQFIGAPLVAPQLRNDALFRQFKRPSTM